MTVKEHIDEAIRLINERRAGTFELKGPAYATPQPGREFSLAITALEDAQMRYTRGRAMQESKFNPADLDA